MADNLNPNQYYRLWNGKKILETNDEAENRLLPIREVTRRIFKGRDFSYKPYDQVGDEILYLVKYKDETYNLIIVNIKNSGLKGENEKNRKRIQISSNIIADVKYPVFVLAVYNAGDKLIYVSSCITDYLRRAQNGKSYSSLWIDFDLLASSYINGADAWKNKTNRFFSAMNSNFASQLTDQELADRLFATKGVNNPTLVEIGDDKATIKLFDISTIKTREICLMPRDSETRRKALEKAEYKCELCGCTNTFKTESNEEYFEGHHIIMYNKNVQERYERSLDTVENIACLCPTCHKEIHYGTQEKRVADVKVLLQRHKELSDIYNIKTIADIGKIIEDYVDNVFDEGDINDE